MNHQINNIITALNTLGGGFWDYAAGVFIQASMLIVLLLILDFMLRKRVRAVSRYCLWMLLFVKLVLPASFTFPTGIGYWLGDYFPSEASIARFVPQPKEAVPMVIDMPQWYTSLEMPATNERVATGVELESISWQGLVFSGWLVGMLALLALLVRRICFVRRLIAQSRSANERLLEMLQECRCQIGIRRNIELRLSGDKLSPAVCGLFRPTILMPAALSKKLSREKLKAVLIHELAHTKRGDGWVNLLQTTLQIVYFYNPLVWIANAMIRRVR
ncbi:MAG: M56 family metallopeptidase, partial [Phycisphaerales bacterium]